MVVPTAMLGLVGSSAIVRSVAGVTGKVAGVTVKIIARLEMPSELAVIFVVPDDEEEAKPGELWLKVTERDDELQVTDEVRSLVELSE